MQWLSLSLRRVSISLSSGFSFQVYKTLGDRVGESDVSISLSSGFSFQENKRYSNRCLLPLFQSRYRAASQFRALTCKRARYQSLFQSRYRAASQFRRLFFAFNHMLVEVSISLSSGFSIQVSPLRIQLALELVSISLSSGFSIQVRPRGAPDTLWLNTRTSASLHFLRDDAC